MWEIFDPPHPEHSSAHAAASIPASAPVPLPELTTHTTSVKCFIDAKVLQLSFKALYSDARTYPKDPPWYPYVLNCQWGQSWQLAQPAEIEL